MPKPLVIDVETQHSFQEVRNDLKKLKISVVGAYDFAQDNYTAFREHELNKLFSLMEHASMLIGFNISRFDLPVISPYYSGDINQFPVLDLLEVVKESLGFRVSLDDLARATLNVKKSGHGFTAIKYFREGKWDDLIKYCLDDVKITKEIYEYAVNEKKLFFYNAKGKREFAVEIPEIKKKNSISLSLPF